MGAFVYLLSTAARVGARGSSVYAVIARGDLWLLDRTP